MSGKVKGKRKGSTPPVTKPRCRSRHERLRRMAKWQANVLNRMELKKWNK